MYNKLIYLSCLIVGLTFFTACDSGKSNKKVIEQPVVNETQAVSEILFSVENQYPHDVTSFTEGFLFHDNKLFESTGAAENLPFTRSLFGIVDMKTGKIDVKAELDKTIYFGEGIVFLNGKVFQLTYKNQKVFIYDAKTFKNIGTFNYTNKEGWGLTTDGKSIIMSDGTSYLTYFNPDSFSVTKVLAVKESGYDVINVNELEFIKGFIYANIWQTNIIIKIDPSTGNVVAKMDLTTLLNKCKTLNPNAEATNGIAYDSISNKILVTGKLWPTIYEIKFPL